MKRFFQIIDPWLMRFFGAVVIALLCLTVFSKCTNCDGMPYFIWIMRSFGVFMLIIIVRLWTELEYDAWKKRQNDQS